MKIGLLGKKIGMTRVYDDKGKATPVTVIEAGGNTALQIKTQENDGYCRRAGRLRHAERAARDASRCSAISRRPAPSRRSSSASSASRMGRLLKARLISMSTSSPPAMWWT